MKAFVRLSCVAALAVASGSYAVAQNTHMATPSVWSLNLPETNFGGGPTEKSDVFNLLVDTEKWQKFTEVWVDGDGKKISVSWSGPQDGTWKPLIGLPGAKASVKAADNSYHAIYADTSTMDSSFVLSADKKKLTFNVTLKTKEGKSFHQVLVFDRIK